MASIPKEEKRAFEEKKFQRKIQPNMHLNFDCKWFNRLPRYFLKVSCWLTIQVGSIVYLCVSSRPSDERHATGWACYDTDQQDSVSWFNFIYSCP
jgi:hypothetical protein